MAISHKRRNINKYLLLAGVCVVFQAFIMQPTPEPPKPEKVNNNLAQYFTPPRLPDRFCNTCVVEVKTKSKNKKKNNTKRISTSTNAVAIPVLRIPVVGATKKSIISFFGDARDNGRKHEGIDIVAPKGTMVVAPLEGTITDVSYNVLGGKVIWLQDSKSKRSYYFAHLDSQIVSKGMIVKAGDTLGTVGNTGNARRTRSHLHFGIYKKDGRTPVDYIRNREQVIAMLAAN